MDQDNYITLIYKRLKKEILPDELDALDRWTASEEENQQLQQQIEQNWAQSKTILPPITIDAKKDFQGFKKRMQQHTALETAPKTARIRPMNSRRRLMAIAAALALPLAAALWLFMPGADVPMTMAQTAGGETKVIQLMDGTTITLNEHSEITYPTTFAAAERQVNLKGEAFFEVASDPNRPFEVQMGTASVKVLGTKFNVRSLSREDKIEVSVEEGKVQFSSIQSKQSVILTKGEAGILEIANNQLSETRVNHKNASAWKTKALTYKNTPLKKVIADLEQHFKVKTIITKEAMLACPLSARFGKATPTIVLEYIADLYQMDLIEIDGQTYELQKGICQ